MSTDPRRPEGSPREWTARGVALTDGLTPAQPSSNSRRRMVRDAIDVLLIGALMIAAGVFAVVALMMLWGAEPPAAVVSYAALVGGCYTCLRVGGMVIGRHIRWWG